MFDDNLGPGKSLSLAIGYQEHMLKLLKAVNVGSGKGYFSSTGPNPWEAYGMIRVTFHAVMIKFCCYDQLLSI